MGSTQLFLVRAAVAGAEGGAEGTTDRRVGSSAAPGARGPLRTRILDGALACIARHGIAKTTIDDIARAGGCSRASVYRAFPDGKESVLAAVLDTELSRFYSALAVRLGDADNLEDVLVEGIAEGTRRIATHDALAYLLEHEPGVVLPFLTFSHLDDLLETSAGFFAPFLGRFLDHDEALRVAQWATRIALSYLSCPAEGTDITDRDDVRRLVRRFVLPGFATDETAPAGINRKGEAP